MYRFPNNKSAIDINNISACLLIFNENQNICFFQNILIFYTLGCFFPPLFWTYSMTYDQIRKKYIYFFLVKSV